MCCVVLAGNAFAWLGWLACLSLLASVCSFGFECFRSMVWGLLASECLLLFACLIVLVWVCLLEFPSVGLLG